MRITLDSPLWLLLLACLPLVLWSARGARGTPRRRMLGAGLRCLLLATVALALARPQLERPAHRLALLLLVDRSGSVAGVPPAQVTEQIDALLAAQRKETQVGLILFGRRPRLAIPPRAGLTREEVARALQQPIDGSQTNLEAALRMAQLAFPPGVERRIVLWSDGNQTEGDALPLAARLAEQQTAIAVYPLRARDEQQLAIDPIRLSTRQAFLGESVELSVQIRAGTAVSGELQIEVAGSRPAGLRRRIELAPGKNGPFQFTLQAQEQGPHRLEAVFTPDRAAGRPARRAAFFHVAGDRPRVLLVEGVEGKERFLAAALEAQQIEVETRPPVGIPTTLHDLLRYDCLILSDVPATLLSVAQMKLVRHYVEQRGGALVMAGGSDSFGRGGWYRTPIEPILPVRIEIPQKLELPSLAIVLALDRSGSMSGKRIELARDAASAVVELLGRRDYLGVVAFDSSASWAVPLQQLARPEQVVAAIARIEASGGTYFYPALQMAYDALLQVKARIKHVILLSDGHSNAADYQGLVTRMALEQITVSTVAVGSGAEKSLMRRIADWGHGRYYFTEDEHGIPQIFTQETIKVARGSLKELPFRPAVHHPHQVVRGIDFAAAPYLQGYVVTRARPTAEVPLVYGGDPILALWRVGLGQVAAFTSDVKDRWAAMWLDWPGFPRLWGQLVRQLIKKKLRARDAGGAREPVSGELRLAPRPGGVEITADLVDPQGRFANRKQVSARLAHQEGGEGSAAKTLRTALRQVAPGRYRTTVPLDRPGTWLVELRAAGTDLLEQADFELAPAGEALSGAAPDHELLGALARRTGGTVGPRPAELHARLLPPGRRAHDLWPWLVLVALLLLPLDLAFRRFLLDPASKAG